MLHHIKVYKDSLLIIYMFNKKDVHPKTQTKLGEFKTHQVSFDENAYQFLLNNKIKLIKKYKRYINFSDVIRELEKRMKGGSLK